jgi:ribosome-binding ATPase YchF (GTP1/OBG family)
MKVGIAGFAGSGKSTVFQWLTEVKPDPAAAQRGQVGIAKIPDDRLIWLSEHFKPKKTTPATIEFLDTPGLLLSERRDNPRRLAILREAGGLLVVLTGYGSSKLADELRRFREEILFADLEIVTNRVQKLRDQLKKPKPGKEREADQEELALLERVAKALEEGTADSSSGSHSPLAGILKDQEEKAVRSFQLLTLKPELVLVNIGDDRIGKPLPDELLALAQNALSIPAKLELELQELADEERQAFMKDLGLTGFSRDEALRAIYSAMGRIVFFTVGEDECRAWSLDQGGSSVEGAGQIHTDLAKGFVRAEVVAYDDFAKVGSMKEAKTKGVYRLEGKIYIVKDGDIMHILAST